MERHKAEDHNQDNGRLGADLQSFRSHDITPDGSPDYNDDDPYRGNIQNGGINRLKGRALDHRGKSKTSGQANKDDVTYEEKTEAPE